MNLDSVITALRKAHNPPPKPYALPNEEDINSAERILGVNFHPDYRTFLLKASDVCVGTLEQCILPPNAGHCDLIKVTTDAWENGIERHLIPICEDNGDYYCMTPSGEIVFISHEYPSNDRWTNLAEWIQSVWLPKAE